MSNKKPKADAKINQFRVLLSDKDLEKLNYCSDIFNLSKADIIRQGIDKTYEKAKKK